MFKKLVEQIRHFAQLEENRGVFHDYIEYSAARIRGARYQGVDITEDVKDRISDNVADYVGKKYGITRDRVYDIYVSELLARGW